MSDNLVSHSRHLNWKYWNEHLVYKMIL